MLFRNYGEAIDAHGLVMRFNGAQTRGYERDVGRDFDSGRASGLIRTAWRQGYYEAGQKNLLASDTLIVRCLARSRLLGNPIFPYMETHCLTSLSLRCEASSGWGTILGSAPTGGPK